MQRIDVLDKGFVELRATKGEQPYGMEQTIANTARTSFLGESKGLEADTKLVLYLLKHQHTSPFEMVGFTFRIYAPNVVWWQWTRHRTMSYNVQSGRYTPTKEDDFYTPTEWRKQSVSNKQGSDGLIENDSDLTDMLYEHQLASFRLYENALSRGVAKEQARLYLPSFSLYTMGIVDVDLHNLMGFLRQRMADDAQYEIRQYANAIGELIKPYIPNVWQWFVNS